MENVSNNSRPRTAPATPKSDSLKPAKTPQSLKSCQTPTSARSPRASAREAAVEAKRIHTAEKKRNISLLKEKWAKEKKERLDFQKKQREEEARLNQKLSMTQAQQRKMDIERKQKIEKQKRAIQEDMVKSSVEEHIRMKKELQEQEKARRRQSIALNREILEKAKRKEAELEKKKKDEEASLLISRQLDYLAVRESREIEEERRRESMAIRGAQAREQRKSERKAQECRQEEIQDILATRKEMWLDDKKQREKQKQKDRQSLANRLKTSKQQREADELEAKQKLERETQELYNRKQEWLDVQRAKDEKIRRDRESLAMRLDSWRRERTLEQEEAARQAEIERNERELMLNELQDIMKFQQEQEDQRRQSLAYRLDTAARERDYLQGLEANKQFVLEKEKQLHEAEREDIQRFRAHLEEERRKSLAFRLDEWRKHRDCDRSAEEAEKEATHRELQIRAEERRDVLDMKEQERQRERQEIARRIEESRQAKEVDLLNHRSLLDRMHADFESRRKDWKALNEAKRQQQERSRMSICMRLDSWRKQKLDREKQKAKDRLAKEHEAMMKQWEIEDIRAAKAKAALEEKQMNAKPSMIF
mmetsp:Transcript_5038/g.7701  ORF Transcript_5038/g.7701 Transcript_5038/m.7701 type:complete len:594 (-) Transcript_5038:116-1897(-)|eukprot:CAMPEP_0185027932 /NCGR_PEP_ID=MMETSP1103-20130426/13284_1 /TAXON_ID=36769 /ORGANISM="Paraphysomonas bandaiensis, Strain Caron Lab Isolate" /LENGTH=593 /DNA_ID=CAMNT_0027562135 /DNA_START=25 /DNA_END=1806 /DNA_ORIENTATION=-